MVSWTWEYYDGAYRWPFGHVANQLENNDGGAVVLMGQPFNHSPASGLISRKVIKKWISSKVNNYKSKKWMDGWMQLTF